MSLQICVSIYNLLTEPLDAALAKDEPELEIAEDINGGFPHFAFQAVYGKCAFIEWNEDLDDEQLVKRLMTGKPTALGLWSLDAMQGMKHVQPGYDNLWVKSTSAENPSKCI